MLPIVIGVAVFIGGINMGFQQAQDNPNAKSFFGSNSHIVQQDGSDID